MKDAPHPAQQDLCAPRTIDLAEFYEQLVVLKSLPPITTRAWRQLAASDPTLTPPGT